MVDWKIGMGIGHVIREHAVSARVHVVVRALASDFSAWSAAGRVSDALTIRIDHVVIRIVRVRLIVHQEAAESVKA